MQKALIRSFVLGVLAFAGCAVTGDAPAGSASSAESSTSAGTAESSVDQAVADPCLLHCQEQKLICMGSCARDPNNPQNDCGCGDAFTLCKAQCATQ